MKLKGYGKRLAALSRPRATERVIECCERVLKLGKKLVGDRVIFGGYRRIAGKSTSEEKR